MAKATGQPMQGVQATQDPEASQLPVSQGPQSEQTPSPLRTVLPHLVLSEEPSGGASLPIQAGESLFSPLKKKKKSYSYHSCSSSFFFFFLRSYFLFSF